jgi:hypothetical protein
VSGLAVDISLDPIALPDLPNARLLRDWQFCGVEHLEQLDARMSTDQRRYERWVLDPPPKGGVRASSSTGSSAG